MAQMYDINSLSYTAKENPEWFTRAMYGGRLIQGGYVRVLTGIKGDELLSQIDLQNKVLQLDGKDCAWTPNKIIKLSEKTAKVKTYKINLEECVDELENKRTLYLLSPGAKNESLPSELESATLSLIAIGLSNEIEEMIIGGQVDTDKTQDIKGIVKTLLESAEAIQLAGTVISQATILDQVAAVYNAIPENVLQAEEGGTLYLLGSYATRRKLRAALSSSPSDVIAQTWSIDDTDKKNPRIYYMGVEFVPVKGINNNTLIAYDSNNAFLLTDLLSDLDEIELGQFPKPHESKVFIKGKLRLGFVVPFEDECVIYSTAIAQDRLGGSNPFYLTKNNLIFDQKTLDPQTTKVVTGTNQGVDLYASAAVSAGGFGFVKGATVPFVGPNGESWFKTPITVTANSTADDALLVNYPGKVLTAEAVITDTATGRVLTLVVEKRGEDVTGVVE